MELKQGTLNIPKGYKNTEVGVIPEEWEVGKIGDLTILKNGYAFSSSYFSQKGPIVITPGNFKLTGGLKFNEKNTLRYSGNITNEMKFKNGDLIIVMTDLTPSCDLLGKPGIVESEEVILHNQRIGKISLKSSRLIKSYLFWFFSSDIFSKRMKETATGSTVRHTSVGSINNTIIPIPPLPEQTAIATVLSDTDSLIQALEKKIAKKELIKKGAMQKLLKPKEGWEVKLLKEISYFLNGNAHEQFIKENAEFIVINSKFISTEGEIFKTSTISLCPLKKGDITMVMSDLPNGKALAKCFLVPEDNKYTLNQRICCLRTESVDNVYLSFILNRNKYYLAFDSGTGQTNLKRTDVLECPIPLPPTIEEQTHIAQILSDMDTEIKLLQEKLSKYNQLKQGLMQELLTGRIRLMSEL